MVDSPDATADAALPPTERARIAQCFDNTPRDDTAFRPSARWPRLQARPLGLGDASGGQLVAEHLRLDGAANAEPVWRNENLDFHFVYVLQGGMELHTDDGAVAVLGVGGCAHLPAHMRHAFGGFTPGFEMVELRAPAQGVSALAERVSRFAVDHEQPDSFKVGDGPRRFLAYRDAAATAATGRRVNINIVRNSKAGDASTGWHYHTLACQFVFVLRGWSRVAVEGEPGEFLLRAGDAMTLPREIKHDVTGFSEDFTVFELNIPADYPTVACAPPASHSVPH